MPKNGDVNKKFGVYKTVCCGSEIVIAEWVTFPDCPVHIKLSTEWRPVEDIKIRHVTLSSNPDTKHPAV